MPERNPSFLKSQFANFHASPEVDTIAARTKDKRKGKGVPNNPEARIQNYLDYLKDNLGLPDETRDKETNSHRFEADDRTRTEKLTRFKSVLHDKYVIKPDQIPDSYFALQQRIAREQGHGNIEITPEMRNQNTEIVIADQKSSMDNWVDYLASPDAPYPDWLKYWAVRSMLGLSEYDKEKKTFPKRRKDTVKPFPHLDREALPRVFELIDKKYSGQGIDLQNLEEEEKTKFEQIINKENFAELYAWIIEKLRPSTTEQLKITQGKWIKYPQWSDPTPLVNSLQEYRTGWCTSVAMTAETQLNGGDFYVYYSLDPKGQPVVPRVAIRMQGNTIAEVRGIAAEQNLDPYIGEVVQQKLAEFPDGKAYEKKNQDMKTLTALEVKIKAEKQLTREDLIFLYEIDKPIQGFGYQKDPRIAELRKTRTDILFDQCLTFNCLPEHIAYNEKEVNEKTKAYIGPLFTNIFKKLVHLENIFTTFPEGKIKKETVVTGGKTKEQLKEEMQKQKIQVSSGAKFLMNSQDFSTTAESEQVGFVRLTVKDLFNDSKNHTIDKNYAKAQQLGLELCQSQDGPNYRLHYKDQPNGEGVLIVTKQIAGAGGNPSVFGLGHDGGGLWLDGGWTDPGDRWGPDGGLVFRLSKYES